MESPSQTLRGHTISVDDAFGLALIAKCPDENRDLIQHLVSPHAKRVAENIVDPTQHRTMPDVCEAAAALQRWANRIPE